MFQRFGFADPLERSVAQHIFDKSFDALERFAVLGLPLEVIFPSAGSPGQESAAHGSISPCSTGWLFPAASRAANRRAAFLGERSR